LTDSNFKYRIGAFIASLPKCDCDEKRVQSSKVNSMKQWMNKGDLSKPVLMLNV